MLSSFTVDHCDRTDIGAYCENSGICNGNIDQVSLICTCGADYSGDRCEKLVGKCRHMSLQVSSHVTTSVMACHMCHRKCDMFIILREHHKVNQVVIM